MYVSEYEVPLLTKVTVRRLSITWSKSSKITLSFSLSICLSRNWSISCGSIYANIVSASKVALHMDNFWMRSLVCRYLT